MSVLDPDESGVIPAVEYQISKQGIATIPATDGRVFIFTEESLRGLLEAAQRGNGRVCLFVKYLEAMA